MNVIPKHYLLFSLALAVLTRPASASTVWDAAQDFSFSNNPAGVWSYGYEPAGIDGYSFKAFDGTEVIKRAGIESWYDFNYRDGASVPTLYKNGSGSDFVGIANGQLAVHPGPVTYGDDAILRFTAPTSAIYDINAQFFNGDLGETKARIVLNGNLATPLIELGATSTNPIFSSYGFSLSAGDTLDFVVGNDGSYYGDTTGLTVRISTSPVPLPAAGYLLLSALCGCGAMRRRVR